MAYQDSSSFDEKRASMDSRIHRESKGMCKNVVHQDVCISAKVNIDPIVDVGPISTHCMSKAEIVPCDGKCADKCSFIVRQHICVEVPIIFGAMTTVDPAGMDCNGAAAGSCDCKR